MDFCYIMLREIHSERECSNMRKIGNFFFFFFFWGGGGGVGAPYIRETLFRSLRVANLGRCHAYLGCRNMLLRDFHLTLFVTDKWVKCYCELILGLASLYYYPGHWIQYQSCIVHLLNSLGSILARRHFRGTHMPHQTTNNIPILPGRP